MSEQVISVIDAICEKFGIMIDWTSQNVIPYLQNLMSRVVSYEIGVYVFWMIFCPIMTAIFGVSAYKLIKKAREVEKYDWFEEPLGIAGIITLLIGVGFTIATFVMIPVGTIRVIECVNIPEKILIEWITNAI